MTVLITGSAGFIGYHLTKALLNQGHCVIGLDNINDYYDVQLKYGRLSASGIDASTLSWGKEAQSDSYKNYLFVRLDLEDKEGLFDLFARHNIDVCINLAAQAGVRYSISHPDAYIRSNLTGFFNILEACRKFKIGHLIYASSSSVYGLNQAVPFSEAHGTNHPVSLYAATKKSNELMAHAYSQLYGLPTTGLRFFTVYGPWGRPDMAYFLFADAIAEGRPIQVFNNGQMKRDFTYVDDVVAAIAVLVKRPATAAANWNPQRPDPSSSVAPYRVFNIGNNEPVELMQFISELEIQLGKKAIMEFKPMQQGDVVATWADVERLEAECGIAPVTRIAEGLGQFAAWYKEYRRMQDPLAAALPSLAAV